QVLITTSILFCVGPMTILGCLQDRLEGKIEILAMKSLLDGVASIFFAAVSGPAVLVTALVVLVVQGVLTMLATPLKAIATEEVVNEAAATGGVLLLAIGFGLAKIAKIPAETYLPALLISPVITSFIAKRRASSPC
ncbi:MAG: DUF554 domain-containing protein, partial [Armatimonadetes bacterium]|nr:DUF554 domain-containing protein [Armatimonadota bacterium]